MQMKLFMLVDCALTNANSYNTDCKNAEIDVK